MGTTIICDVGQSAGGDILKMFQWADILSEISTDLVFKGQVHYPEDQPSRADYWRETGFSDTEWCEIAAYARHKGLEFAASAFSIRAVELLEDIGVPFHKVASGQVTNLPMIERMARCGKDILVSDGLATQEEINAVVNICMDHGAKFRRMTCQSVYPCPPERIHVLGDNSFSDHSGSIWPPILAILKGCPYIEFHVKMSPFDDCKDAESSLDQDKIEAVVAAKQFIEKMGSVEYKPDEKMREKYLWPQK